MIEVIQSGLLTTIQDRGRPGYAHLGVARSGALDVPALDLANRLVGNGVDAAVLETTLTGCTLRAQAGVTVAVTGAPAEITVDGYVARFGAPVRVPAGAELKVGPARTGVRSYLAIAGGIAVAPVLGSRSSDTLSGLGPPTLRRGDNLPLFPSDPDADHTALPAGAGRDQIDYGRGCGWEQITLRVRFGPRADWFTAAARDTLLRCAYTLSPKSNRVGARLTGDPLTRAITDELPSEGIVLGAVQVPADGQPLIFLADHPTTGGYPVLAVVDQADLPLLAQARPGATVRFMRVVGTNEG